MTVALIHPDDQWLGFVEEWLPEAYPNEPCYTNYYFSILSFLSFGMDTVSLCDILAVEADTPLAQSSFKAKTEEVLSKVYPWIDHVRTFSQLTEALVFEIKARRPELPVLIFSHRQVPSAISIAEGVSYLEKTAKITPSVFAAAVRQAIVEAKLVKLRDKYKRP